MLLGSLNSGDAIAEGATDAVLCVEPGDGVSFFGLKLCSGYPRRASTYRRVFLTVLLDGGRLICF